MPASRRASVATRKRRVVAGSVVPAGSVGRARARSGASQIRSPFQSSLCPGDQRRPDIGTVPAERDQGGRLRLRGARVQDLEQAVGDRRERCKGARRREPRTSPRLVVQRRDEVRGRRVAVGRGRQRTDRRATDHGRRIGEAGPHGLERDRVAEVPRRLRARPRGPPRRDRRAAPARCRWTARPARAIPGGTPPRHGRPGPGRRRVRRWRASPRWRRGRRSRRRPACGRPPIGRRHRCRPARPWRPRRPAAGHPGGQGIQRRHPDGRHGVVVHDADQEPTGTLGRGAAKQTRGRGPDRPVPVPRAPPAGPACRPDPARSACSPGPPSRTCSPNPARSAPDQAGGIATPDARRRRRSRRGPCRSPAGTSGRSREAAAGQQQEARDDGADLGRDAVVEGHDLGPPLGRDDVVEGAPGGVRDAALGHLLGEPEERGGREPERDQPQAEAAQVHEREQERGTGDAEPRVDAVGEQERDDKGRRRHRGRQQAERRREARPPS